MRLIDADALFKMVERSRNVNTHEEEEFRRAHEYEHSHFLHLITEQPAIDAVPVVRCRECMYSASFVDAITHERNGLWCAFWDLENLEEDFYCKDGERREDGDTDAAD